MKNLKWEEVEDSRRTDDSEVEAIAEKLLAGKTIHVKGVDNSDLSAWYSRFLTRHQRKLRRRQAGKQASEGYIVWLAPEDEE